MKELQIENVSSILNHFYFLIYEHYSVKDMTIGLRAYPSVVFKNHQLGLSCCLIPLISRDLDFHRNENHICYRISVLQCLSPIPNKKQECFCLSA